MIAANANAKRLAARRGVIAVELMDASAELQGPPKKYVAASYVNH